MANEINPQDSNWQQQTIEKLALSGYKEQKSARRWSIFFKLLTFAYLGFLLIMAFGWFGGSHRCGKRQHPAGLHCLGRHLARHQRQRSSALKQNGRSCGDAEWR